MTGGSVLGGNAGSVLNGTQQIWLYAYYTLYWLRYRDNPPPPRRVRKEVGFGDLLDMPDFYRASDDRHLDLGQAPQPDLPEFRNAKSKPNGRANGWLGE